MGLLQNFHFALIVGSFSLTVSCSPAEAGEPAPQAAAQHAEVVAPDAD